MTTEIKKKDFTFRGKTLEELKTLSIREFAKYLRARERRTIMRQFQKTEEFINRMREKLGKDKTLKTHERDIVIVPEMVGMKIQVHDGKGFFPVPITADMMGHRLGEFAVTRAKVKHSKAGIGATKGSKSKAKK